jgi:hypothetical protein
MQVIRCSICMASGQSKPARIYLLIMIKGLMFHSIGGSTSRFVSRNRLTFILNPPPYPLRPQHITDNSQ